MRISILALVLLGTTACKTTEAASDVKSDGLALTANSAPGDKRKKDEKAAVPVAAVPVAADPDKESLLKWRVGRWSIVLNGVVADEKMDKDGSVVCDVTAGLVKEKLGAEKVTALKTAIAEAYKIKDQRQISPIFRGLDQSRELIAVYKGEEYLVEKMFQSRDAIQPVVEKKVGRDMAKSGEGEAAIETITSIAINPQICKNRPL